MKLGSTSCPLFLMPQHLEGNILPIHVFGLLDYISVCKLSYPVVDYLLV